MPLWNYVTHARQLESFSIVDCIILSIKESFLSS